jgi:hypothetical protein
VGAWDQYIPDAGAGKTSGAVIGSGNGGTEVCGPLGGLEAAIEGLDDIVIVGEAAFRGRLAIADVERNAKGLRASSRVGFC